MDAAAMGAAAERLEIARMLLGHLAAVAPEHLHPALEALSLLIIPVIEEARQAAGAEDRS